MRVFCVIPVAKIRRLIFRATRIRPSAPTTDTRSPYAENGIRGVYRPTGTRLPERLRMCGSGLQYFTRSSSVQSERYGDEGNVNDHRTPYDHAS